jgi:hypothetical protein
LSVAKTAGNKPQGGSGRDAPSKGRRSGGGPLNKGVIQLLYAGTGRESRTFSGPKAVSVNDHEESAKPTVGKNGSGPRRDKGAVRVRVEGEGVCDGHEEGTAPGEGEPASRRRGGRQPDGGMPSCAALWNAA